MDPTSLVISRSKKYIYTYKYCMTIVLVSNDHHVPPTTAKTVPHQGEKIAEYTHTPRMLG